jgi:hypothetical protein
MVSNYPYGSLGCRLSYLSIIQICQSDWLASFANIFDHPVEMRLPRIVRIQITFQKTPRSFLERTAIRPDFSSLLPMLFEAVKHN